ncbi:MAG: aromatic amino acid lyase, partial [Alphaproteobacteria bacterium]
MTVIVNSRRDFTLENYRRVMLGGESLKVGPRAKKAMTDARKSFRAFLESDPTQFIYGVTSGFGPQAKTAVSPEEQRKHAERTNPTRQTGAGFGTQMLPDRVVRGIIFSLLSSLIEGHGKVRPAIAERLAAMLDRPLPEVPLSGQVGAGEILPLAHVLSAMPEGDW